MMGEIQPATEMTAVKEEMTTKDLLLSEFPDEDDVVEDPHYQPEEASEGEEGQDAEDDDEEDAEEVEEEEVDPQEVSDICAVTFSMQQSKLRSGTQASGNYRDQTIMDFEHDEEDDEDYVEGREEDNEEGEDDDDEDDDEEDDEHDGEAMEEDVDADEVKETLIGAAHVALPVKDATILRDGKVIPATQEMMDLTTRMQELMDKEF
ncbi:hypothetical protein HDV05_007102 [Chytridiales sp. JEL 0842]|nr:hypothetical protein HDV05_007102 [Chytridiales sp. JEL 0842]